MRDGLGDYEEYHQPRQSREQIHPGRLISILFAALVLLLEEEMRTMGVRRTSLLQLTRWTPR